ncbi:MAG: NAD(P)H-dependent oxidoreductase, partial [Rhodobacterales bacterium]|nr:NAD(P)H-dependent oxidoreductase [Rhodobacterales bacterium]
IGPECLLKGKKAIIAIASGGTAVGSDLDHAAPYLRFIFGFLGITDVTIVDKTSLGALT